MPRSHPFILKLFDYGQHEDTVYLVMELLTGGNLAQVLHNQRPTPEQVLRIVDQIAAALDNAHKNGVVHRDLKPQNVLLDKEGNAILSDFGIAKLTTAPALTGSGASMGTPHYMSPEQWQGKALDNRTDIYSLGVMLYKLLSGHLPYDADTPASLMYLHLMEPIPSVLRANPGLPAAVEQVIRKAMAKRPEDRFHTAGELATALRAAMGTVRHHEAIPGQAHDQTEQMTTLPLRGAVATPEPEPVRLKPGKMRALIPVIGLLAIIAVVAVVAVLASGSGDKRAGVTVTPTIPAIAGNATDTSSDPTIATKVTATPQPAGIANTIISYVPTEIHDQLTGATIELCRFTNSKKLTSSPSM